MCEDYVSRRKMNTGPVEIFDQEDFNNIFEKCVHLIGSINTVEEIFSVQGKAFVEHPLIPLRQISLDCLNQLDQLTQILEQGRLAQLTEITETFSILAGTLKEILQKDLRALDAEMKESFLPSIIQSLIKLQHVLLSQAHEANKHSEDDNKIFPSYVLTHLTFQNPFGMGESPFKAQTFTCSEPILYLYDWINRSVVVRMKSLLESKTSDEEMVEMKTFSSSGPQ